MLQQIWVIEQHFRESGDFVSNIFVGTKKRWEILDDFKAEKS